MIIQLDHQGRRVSIANVQGTTEIPEMQGLRPAWLAAVPGSTEIHLYDRDPGAVAGAEKILCHAVLPLFGKPEICMYRTASPLPGSTHG